GASMAVYLSAGDPESLQDELLAGGYGPDTPALAACRVGWPGERILRAPLGELARAAREQDMARQTVFLILPGEAGSRESRSRLYDPGFSHGWRSCNDGTDET
ncbi:MAG: cobalt-precorrin-4 C(11)-methyltransferase, partial [Desulfovibrionaceae bacterium]